MDLGLKNKKVLITGSTKGIGFAAAKLFQEEGAQVAITSSSQDNVDSASEKLGNCLAIHCDVGDPEDVDSLFSTIRREWGELDVLVNNAGIMLRKRVCDVALEEWERLMNVNLRGTWLCCKYAGKLMMETNGGVILNTSSMNSVIPVYATGVYAASKAAINALTSTLAGELAPYNIRVNAYIPGFIPTDLNRARREKAASESELATHIAMQRLGTVEEMADAIVYLCSARASYMTGSVVKVNGGSFAVQNCRSAWLDR